MQKEGRVSVATVRTGVLANLSNKIATIIGKFENETGYITDQIAQPRLALPTNVGRRPVGFWPHLHSQIFL